MKNGGIFSRQLFSFEKMGWKVWNYSKDLFQIPKSLEDNNEELQEFIVCIIFNLFL